MKILVTTTLLNLYQRLSPFYETLKKIKEDKVKAKKMILQ
mgnify:CR=1 FL=1